jgi:hypothetical protein
VLVIWVFCELLVILFGKVFALGIVVQHFQYHVGYRNYPPLSDPLRCARVGAGHLGLLRAACVFVRHVLASGIVVQHFQYLAGDGKLPTFDWPIERCQILENGFFASLSLNAAGNS